MAEYIVGTDGDEGHWITGEIVVRCRDCEEWCLCDGRDYGWCNMNCITSEPDGFCKWAEPKEVE